MSFVKRLWKDRISQYPNRRTINDGYVTKQVTVGRDEGTVTEQGDAFNASNMNDLEDRIYAAIEQGGGGGGGGTYDYTELMNKPQVNGNELSGNKTTTDLGIYGSNTQMSAIDTDKVADRIVELATDKLNKSDLIKDASNYTLNNMRTPGFYSGGFTDSPDSSISTYGFAIVTGLPNVNNIFQLFVTQKWNGNFGIYARTSIDGTTWNVWRFISGTKSDVKSQITFSETITGTNTQAWLKDGNLIIYYQGENKAHGVNDVLFTLPSNLRPAASSYPTFVINGISFGCVEIAKETGIAKIVQLSGNATGRVYFHCVIPLV